MKGQIYDKLTWIYNGWGINSYFYDCDQQELGAIYNKYGENYSEYLTKELLQNIRMLYQKEKRPVVYQDSEAIYFLGFYDQWGRLYVFGPVAMDNLSIGQLHAYRLNHNITVRDYQIPRLSLAKLINLLVIAAYILTGKSYSEDELMASYAKEDQEDEMETLISLVQETEKEKRRLTYEHEQRWLERIIKGTTEMPGLKSESSDIERIGTMAENNQQKQIEYAAVAGVTLITRAAIQGGVPPEDAYRISDLYLQEIAKCSNAVAILRIIDKAQADFIHRVRRSKRNKIHSGYVKQCIDYITKNLRAPLRVAAIAEELGVNRSHLSRVFSNEIGMSISDYIAKERLSVSVNLLKYSEVSIGQIAEYVGFTSHSRFTTQFKKQYGIVPAEYRKMYEINEFRTKKKSQSV